MVLRAEDIRERLDLLREMLRRLDAHRSIALDAFLLDADAQDLVLRRLEVAVSCVLDVAAHILAGDFAAHPDTYEEAIAELPRRGVVSAALGERLRGLGGFRNVIVHGYAEIDLERVHELLVRRTPDLAAFAREIERYLDARGREGKR